MIFCLLGAAARAHDPFLSNTDVRLRPGQMEVKCSLACFSALLLDNPHPTNALPVLDEDNFGDFVPMLKRQGEKMFEITAGGTVLAAADLIARTIASPRQLPVGAIMAIVGAPIFLALLRARNRNTH